MNDLFSLGFDLFLIKWGKQFTLSLIFLSDTAKIVLLPLDSDSALFKPRVTKFLLEPLYEVIYVVVHTLDTLDENINKTTNETFEHFVVHNFT